jgi:hypothetical protein
MKAIDTTGKTAIKEIIPIITPIAIKNLNITP